MTAADLPPASLRLLAAAEKLGLAITVHAMPGSTRTAADAAAACGTSVGQIVKSLVFRGAESHRPLLLLVSGSNRVDEIAAAATIGEPLARADARFVRDITGFAIGGIPPFGHDTALKTWFDKDLLAYSEVWAAAGTPHTVFPIAPQSLFQATGARLITLS